MAPAPIPYRRLHLALRVILVVLIMAGAGTTVFHLTLAENPPTFEAQVTITLHANPDKGYGSALLEHNQKRIPISDTVAITAALGEMLSASERTCLLRVAPGVSQNNVHAFRNLLAQVTDDAKWDIRLISLEHPLSTQSEDAK